MIQDSLDWTHKHITITDIRKLNKLYIIIVNDPKSKDQINQPLFIKDNIFEERIESYFFKNIGQITREDILKLSWNMYITLNYYIKVDKQGNITKFEHPPIGKWYVSYLEIEGPLGNFESIYKREYDIKDL